MKIFKPKGHSYQLFVVLFPIFCFLACSKENDNNLQKGNLEVNLQGVQDYVGNEKIGSASLHKPSGNSLVIHSYDEFDAIIDFSVSDSYASEKGDVGKFASSSLANKNVSKVAAAVPIQDTVKYRLLIYKGNETTPAYNLLLSKGDVPNISLYIGYTYKWVAYSINQSTVPDVDSNIVPKATISNKDFMYDSDNIVIAEGTNYLNITFRRLTSLLEVNLDTRGMFGSVASTTNVKISNGNSGMISRTADFNVLNGQFVANTYQDVAVNAVLMKNVDANDIPSGMKKVATFYSVGLPSAIEANSLNIRLEPLAITLHEGTVRTFATQNVSLTHPALTPAAGRKYTITTNLIESAIQVVESGARWARSNLWYDASAVAGNRYRFRVSPHYRDLANFWLMPSPLVGMVPFSGYNRYYTDPNDLWNYGAATPSGARENVDPCKNVFPQNLWTMPSSTNFRELAFISGATVKRPDALWIVNRNDMRGGFGINLGLGTVTLFNTERYELLAKWNSLGGSKIDEGYGKWYTPNYESDMNNLYLSAVGYRRNSTGDFEAISRPSATNVLDASLLGSNLVNLGLASGLSGGGFYWTSDNLSSGNSYFSFTVENTSLVSLGLVELLSVRVLNAGTSYVSSLGTGLPATSGLNIRCVRNTASSIIVNP